MNNPINVLSFGAGVQSSYIARASIIGELPPFDVVVFADTGDEPDDVYENLEWWKQRLTAEGVDFRIVGRKTGISETIYDTLENKKHGLPIPAYMRNSEGKCGTLRRQCTNNWKVREVRRAIREIAGVPRKNSHIKDILVEQTIGISWDESQRMRDAPYPWVRNVYPLVNRRITRTRIIETMQNDSRFPKPPRSACWHCPYRSDEEWVYMKDHQPEAWAKAVDLDNALRQPDGPWDGNCYLHKSLKPLSEVVFKSKPGTGSENKVQESLFEQECEGMCGL